MVVFAISLFGTTLPHIFYGESLLNHMNTMQGRGPLVPYTTTTMMGNRTDSLAMLLDNSTNFGLSDLPDNLCHEMGSQSLNRSEKSEFGLFFY